MFGGIICLLEGFVYLLFDNLAIYGLGGVRNFVSWGFVVVSGPAMRCVRRCPIDERRDVVGWERFKKM